MVEVNRDNLKQWYGNMRPIYEALTNIVNTTIETLIKREKIDYLSVTSRTKTVDSLLEKSGRKSYRKPEEEITDLAGIRVITFIETDVTKVCKLVESIFNVHPSKSLNKADELGIDRFGYRSVHYVCDLGKDRIKIPEFSPYKGLLFELQVRTVLQHAWAEIEHDRNYKFSGVLPTPIQRRLYSLAGVLEIVDREFSALADEVDRYAAEVSQKARSGDLDIELNSTSLQEYLPEKIRQIDAAVLTLVDDTSVPEIIIDELRMFGIHTLSDLDKILGEKLFELVKKHQLHTTYSGLLRNAMMYSDIDEYFNEAWDRHWEVCDDDSLALLSEKYGAKKVNRLFRKNDIHVINLADDEFGTDELPEGL